MQTVSKRDTGTKHYFFARKYDLGLTLTRRNPDPEGRLKRRAQIVLLREHEAFLRVGYHLICAEINGSPLFL